jgi:GNAT superfamily N-acetyltransferase
MTPVALRTRLATADDVPAIARIHVRSWQSTYRGQIPDPVLDALDEGARRAAWLECLAAPRRVLHVAARDGELIGFCSLVHSRDPEADDLTGEISAIYVDPAHVRCGAGSALLRASLSVARAAGYRVLTLWVLVSNTNARQFYARHGFVPDGGTKVEARAGYALSEIRYRLELAEA